MHPMKRFTGLAVLILFLLIPIFSASAHIDQHFDKGSVPGPPTLNVAKRQLNLERCGAAIERSRRLPGQERSVILNSTEVGYNLNFTNKELDRDLELNYFGARYYHPELPRFISPDPVGGKPAIPMSWNRYLYCRNDPVNAFDPDGRKLRFSNGASDSYKAQVKSAVDHLNAHGAAGTIAKLEARPEIVTIQEGNRNDQYDPQTKSITWDPTGAVVSANGEKISPATALSHECGHALLDLENPVLAANLSDQDYKENSPLHSYGNAEEYYVITTYEWPVAEKLGEDKRTVWEGTYATVVRPTDSSKTDEEVKLEE